MQLFSIFSIVKRWYRTVRRGLYRRTTPAGRRRGAMAGAAAVCVAFIFYLAVLSAPSGFPEHTLIQVKKGESLSTVAEKLEEHRVVQSAFWLKNAIRAMGGERTVRAGEYYFNSPRNLVSVAFALRTGDYGLEPAVVTVREGDTIFDIAERLDAEMASFNPEAFIAAAGEHEGYLFPDTYHFRPTASNREVIAQMRENFNEKIATIKANLRTFNRPLKDVITMASLLEKEARTKQSKQIIAGILWKRIEIGMPLQVDAVFPYINGKNTFELTLEDLQHESAYNTYRYPGLPPGPIANPGLESIKAAVTPQESDYLFYLSDISGTMHYSETFEEHKAKKRRYLN